MKHKLRVTITAEVEADDTWYGEGINGGNIAEAYKINLDENPELIEHIIENEWTVAVERIE